MRALLKTTHLPRPSREPTSRAGKEVVEPIGEHPRVGQNSPRIAWLPHDSWGGLMISAAARIRECGRADLCQSGLGHLSMGRVGVMSLLATGPLTQANLCAALLQKPPSMMEMLRRLHKEELVHAHPDPTDRRKVLWSLTRRGARDIAKVQQIFRRTGKRVDRLFGELGVAGDVEHFKCFLRLFLQQFGQYQSSNKI